MIAGDWGRNPGLFYNRSEILCIEHQFDRVRSGLPAYSEFVTKGSGRKLADTKKAAHKRKAATDFGG